MCKTCVQRPRYCYRHRLLPPPTATAYRYRLLHPGATAHTALLANASHSTSTQHPTPKAPWHLPGGLHKLHA